MRSKFNSHLKKILILSTYPYKRPFHGGQHRLLEIANAYKKAGFEVTSLSVYDQASYKPTETNNLDIPFDLASEYRSKVPFTDDLQAGKYLSNDPKAWKQFKNLMVNKNINAIHFEQPWLYPAVKRIKKEFKDDLYTIFGSQNVEYRLKSDIFKQYNLDSEATISVINEIKNLEIESVSGANITLVVTKQDAEWFGRYTKNDIILIPNGARPLEYKKRKVDALKKQIKAERYVVFIASAHPPNIDGFNKYIGDSLACVPPDSKLVCVGTISTHVERILKQSTHRHMNVLRLFTTGRVDNNTINNLIMGSLGVLLPISTGGGSNLKTAEALVSGKQIIGTKKAFRGYETYHDLNRVRMASSKNEFRNKIRDLFLSNDTDLVNMKNNNVSDLLWSNTTKDLVNYFKGES